MAFVIWFWVMCVTEARRLCECGCVCVTAGVHVFQWDGLTINSWLIDESPTLWPITSPSSPLSISVSVGCVGAWACEKGGQERLFTDYFVLCFIQGNKNHLFRIFRCIFCDFTFYFKRCWKAKSCFCLTLYKQSEYIKYPLKNIIQHNLTWESNSAYICATKACLALETVMLLYDHPVAT